MMYSQSSSLCAPFKSSPSVALLLHPLGDALSPSKPWPHCLDCSFSGFRNYVSIPQEELWMNCVPQKHMLQSQPLIPVIVTLYWEIVFLQR